MDKPVASGNYDYTKDSNLHLVYELVANNKCDNTKGQLLWQKSFLKEMVETVYDFKLMKV